MTGKAEVDRLRQQLDATFDRVRSIQASNMNVDMELLSDYARYLCVLTSGFLEKAIAEILLDYTRKHSDRRVQKQVEQRLRQLTNVKSKKLFEVFGSFDSSWREDLEIFVVDEYKAAIDSIVELRNNISHGNPSQVTLRTVGDYYARIKHVVEYAATVCGV